MLFHTPGWDASLQRLLNQQWRWGAMDALAPLLSSGALLAGACAVAALWCAARRRWTALAVLLAALAAVGLADAGANVVKHAVGRVRPLNAVAGTYLHEDGQWTRRAPDFAQTKERGSSYVSSHAANTMALAVAAALLWPGAARAARAGLLLLPLAVGYSRIYLGKHYPSDVLGGWLVGLFAGLVVWAAFRAAARAWARRPPPGR
ncbi:MAG: phosphatase PAP2 family protein [Desulfovibrionaceae bacterium]|jgi:undecaprenyl-diphosphatase|nr:phosphatase PAP2 family protein [Desulfovibrionaceae bacterium]